MSGNKVSTGPSSLIPFSIPDFNPRMKYVIKLMQVREFLKPEFRAKLDLNLAFQRKEDVWSPAQERKFIDSLIQQFPIPPLIIWEKNSDVLGLVDGKQRMSTIFKVPLRDKKEALKFPKDYKLEEYKFPRPQSFYDWPINFQRRFLDSSIAVYFVRISDEENDQYLINEFFCRMNSGKPLNEHELRCAIGGNAVQFGRELEEAAKIFKLPGLKPNNRCYHSIASHRLIQFEYGYLHGSKKPLSGMLEATSRADALDHFVFEQRFMSEDTMVKLRGIILPRLDELAGMLHPDLFEESSRRHRYFPLKSFQTILLYYLLVNRVLKSERYRIEPSEMAVRLRKFAMLLAEKRQQAQDNNRVHRKDSTDSMFHQFNTAYNNLGEGNTYGNIVEKLWQLYLTWFPTTQMNPEYLLALHRGERVAEPAEIRALEDLQGGLCPRCGRILVGQRKVVYSNQNNGKQFKDLAVVCANGCRSEDEPVSAAN